MYFTSHFSSCFHFFCSQHQWRGLHHGRPHRRKLHLFQRRAPNFSQQRVGHHRLRRRQNREKFFWKQRQQQKEEVRGRQQQSWKTSSCSDGVHVRAARCSGKQIQNDALFIRVRALEPRAQFETDWDSSEDLVSKPKN